MSPKSVPDLLISVLLMHMAVVTLVNVWKCVYVTHGVSWLGGLFLEEGGSRLSALEVLEYWKGFVIRYGCEVHSEPRRLLTLLPLMCFTWSRRFLAGAE